LPKQLYPVDKATGLFLCDLDTDQRRYNSTKLQGVRFWSNPAINWHYSTERFGAKAANDKQLIR
jgi:hypothetical protein